MMSWQRFLTWCLGTAIVGALLVFAFILIVDPYQNVPFSPALPRAPVAQNQRYAYPSIARSPTAQAAVIGSSVVRLLNPSRLESQLGAPFVNLAMNDATPLEQTRMLAFFAHHHPEARFLILSIDNGWCAQSETRRKFTLRGFPEFMYDENSWNDLLYLFNDKALENAVRMLQLLMGRRKPKYGTDGYADFSDDPADRAPELVRHRIHGSPGPITLMPATSNLEPAHLRPHEPMAELEALDDLLSRIPRGARAVLLMPPVHAWSLQQGAEHYRECKARVLDVAARWPAVSVLDFMLDNEKTRLDANFLDSIHYVSEFAVEIEKAVALVLEGGTPDENWVRLRQTASSSRTSSP